MKPFFCMCVYIFFQKMAGALHIFGLGAKKKQRKAGQLDESAWGTCPEKLAFVLFIF